MWRQGYVVAVIAVFVVSGSLLALAGAAPARATGAIECHALDETQVSVTLILGALPVSPVLHVRARIGPLAWSTTAEGDARRWLLAQGFVDERFLAVDLVDEQALRRIASIRLLHAVEGAELYRYGYLQLHGQSVHPLACVGP
jgi:hypothetical protein